MKPTLSVEYRTDLPYTPLQILIEYGEKYIVCQMEAEFASLEQMFSELHSSLTAMETIYLAEKPQ